MRPSLLAVMSLLACSGEPVPSDGGADARIDPGPTPPAEEPARARVRFEVSGTGAFVVSRGRSCAPFDVERQNGGAWERVALDLGVTCVCECASPGTPVAIELEPLTASAPVTVRWDGRRMAFVQRTIDCATRSFTGRGTATEYVGALQPLPAGRYRVSFATVRSVPSHCMKLMSGYWCPPVSTAGAPSPGPFALCPGTRVTAEFDLPESGEVTVPVRLGG